MTHGRGLIGRIPPAGTRVRLTWYFLAATGQVAGGEGQSAWLTVAHDGCALCAEGRFVAVNEPSESDPARPRHIHAANLEIVGAAPRACDQADEVGFRQQARTRRAR